MVDEKAAATFELDGVQYPLSDLSDTARQLIVSIKDVDSKLREATNLAAIFTRAKNSYVQGLKDEIIKNKAGL